MATCSSSRSSLAPTDFDISTSFEDTHGVISVAVERCPLCRHSRNYLFCENCIKKGDFAHSEDLSRTSHRFVDKKSLWLSKKEMLKELHSRNEDLEARVHAVSEKKNAMFFCKQRIELLKRTIKTIQIQSKIAKSDLLIVKKNNSVLKTRRKKLEDKQSRLCDHIVSTKQSLADSQERLASAVDDLAQLRRSHVEDLFQFIFTVKEIQPKCDPDQMKVSTVSALAEARQTAYIRGRWVYLDNSSELQYSIVEPSLPGSGDYAAYALWVTTNREPVAGQPDQLRNPAYTYLAALAYTSQLVTVLAHILDARLPRRLCYSEFLSADVDEARFKKLVCYLNYNIVHLCCAQLVPFQSINIRHTLHNLVLLTRAPNLGRTQSFELNQELIQSMEESSQWEDSDDDDDDNDDAFDWENVPTSLPEVPFGSSQSSSIGSTVSQATSLASSPPGGGLMLSAATSLASFWRAATGTDKK